MAQNNLDLEVVFTGSLLGSDLIGFMMTLQEPNLSAAPCVGLNVKGPLSADSMSLCKNNNTKTQSIPCHVTRMDLHAKQ